MCRSHLVTPEPLTWNTFFCTTGHTWSLLHHQPHHTWLHLVTPGHTWSHLHHTPYPHTLSTWPYPRTPEPHPLSLVTSASHPLSHLVTPAPHPLSHLVTLGHTCTPPLITPGHTCTPPLITSGHTWSHLHPTPYHPPPEEEADQAACDALSAREAAAAAASAAETARHGGRHRVVHVNRPQAIQVGQASYMGYTANTTMVPTAVPAMVPPAVHLTAFFWFLASRLACHVWS